MIMLDFLNLSFIFAHISCTELVLALTVVRENHVQSRVVAICTGAILGVLWYTAFGVGLEPLLTNFLVSTGFYSLVVKYVKSKLKQ
jgi:hypothetical protein